jgi:hypothetical protein
LVLNDEAVEEVRGTGESRSVVLVRERKVA